MIDKLDHAVLDWVAAHLATPWLDTIMRVFSSFWAFAWLLLGIAVWLVWRGGDRGRVLVATALLLVLVTDQLAASVVKPLVARPRPHGGSSFSFPSVHATNIAAQAALFARFYPRIATALAAIVALVGFSRVYLQKHYPSDVIAGVIIGAALGWLAGRGALRWGERAVAWMRIQWFHKRNGTAP